MGFSCINSHKLPLQAVTGISGAVLAIGAGVTYSIPAVYGVTTFALPLVLAVGSLLAWVALIAITCSRPPITSLPKKVLSPDGQIDIEPPPPPSNGKNNFQFSEQLIAYCKSKGARFLNEMRAQEGNDNFQLCAASVASLLLSVQEVSFQVTDLDLLKAIQTQFDEELKYIKASVQGLPSPVIEPVYALNTEVEKQLTQLMLTFKTPQKEHLEAFEAILDGMSNVNQTINRLEDTPLFYIAKRGRPIEFLDILIKRGANFDQQETFFGNTPLHWAIANAANDMALAIIQKGKQDLNMQDKRRGNTPLTLAVAKGYTTLNADGNKLSVSNLQLVEALLEKGADPNAKDRKGTSPLMLAVMRRDVPMAKALLEKGAKLDFNWQEMLNLTYEAVCDKIQQQASPYRLEKKSFDTALPQMQALLEDQ